MKERICPKCNKKYQDKPSISRLDNKTEICPTCGLVEAVKEFERNRIIKNAKARNL